MKESVPVTGWSLAIIPNKTVKQEKIELVTAEDVRNNPYGVIDAVVPGNFELDMMRAGLLPDLYYGDNILKAQELENRHLWYAAEFESEPREDCDAFLNFEGIDTAAEIFLDGKFIGFSENMFVPFVYRLEDEAREKHSLVVHIIPAMIYARDRENSAAAFSHSFNDDSLKLRKAPYMYGWDIMCRIVSAGLWKPVTVEYRPKNRIRNVFLYPHSLSETHADMRCRISVTIEEDFASDYSYRVEGSCRGRSFVFDRPLMSVDALDGFAIPDPYLWYPHNYGEQNLYNVRVSLLYRGAVCDVKELRVGLRITEIDRTSLAGDDGEFVIKVNGQKIFCMGSNLVPTDAFPSRMKDYTMRQCEMLADLGCNIVRCWGGNIYPDEAFFDFCDEHGILVWQDFSMACGRYPQDPHTRELLEKEVVEIVRRFRNHASLAVWAGDNECDSHEHKQFWNGRRCNAVDPNSNLLTRGLIPFVLRNEDFTRPYLPSSPYVDQYAFAQDLSGNEQQAEQHLWGPRDFFKGPFYVDSTAHFASETGYHGCPSPDSLKRFISPEHLDKMGDGKKSDDPQWMLHSSTFRTDSVAPYNYRTSLMIRQVERLFGEASKDLETFALQSQISQAEAKKFFIEHFRCGKWRRTGIIWWNLIDGWPQVSDAVVDWYGVKKLAYSYIKRSQQAFCMMFDEPAGGKIKLRAANDTQSDVRVEFKVTDLTTGTAVLLGECSVPANGNVALDGIIEVPGAFYLIEWTGDQTGRNHYAADIYHGLNFEQYVENMKKAGFYDALEGFGR